MSKYKHIDLDLTRDELFSEQGKTLLQRYYSDGKAGIQSALARAAYCYSYGDEALSKFIYEAASKQWFFFSSPILSNAIDGEWTGKPTRDDWFAVESGFNITQKYWKGPKPKALPIACFLTYLGDSIAAQIEASSEIAHLSVLGGGTSLHSRIRAESDVAPGPIPFMKTVDGNMGYYRQGKTRRGSNAVYLDVNHPAITEFIQIRTPSGGDSARKIDNRAGVHIGVNITSTFIDKVDANEDFPLQCPHTGEVKSVMKARALWESMIDSRELTGEPYMHFIDVTNEHLNAHQKALGLRNSGSNLCSEITLATSEERTAVCCLSSVNLEKYDEWKDTELISKLVEFLDNVLQWFIDFAPPTLARAVFSARRERAIGIGAMGWHNFLMSKHIPFESGGFNSAVSWNHLIFKDMQTKGIRASSLLALYRGEPADLVGSWRRNSHLFAIAPNANSSVLCNTSPSIEPVNTNAYPQKSRAGISLVVNKFLKQDLQELGMDTPEIWQKIIEDNGSVQGLEGFPENLKLVYKTAWEIDQHWVVQHAEDRQEYICQAQSLNLFFLPGTDRAYINSVHLKAARGRKVKSLYYFRTGAEVKADTVTKITRRSLDDWKPNSDVCVSCEG